jgi:hypothetical protein
MKELVTTATERVIQAWSAVPINYAACSRAANDAAQAADKAIRQLKAMPKGQVAQAAELDSFTRAFGTFASAMRLLSDGARRQDVEAVRRATRMVLQSAREIKQTQGGRPDLSPFVPNLPQGWKGLRFGMSERDVRNVVNKKWPSGNGRGLREWSVDGDSRIPALTEDGIFDKVPSDDCLPDRQTLPLRVLKVENLDDAFNQLSLWFLRGKLIAIMAKPREEVAASDVVQKAADTYAVQPRLVPIVFGDHGVEGASPNPDGATTVNYWRGNNTTVMIWSYSFVNPFFSKSGCPVYIFSDPGIKEVLRVVAESENSQRRASEKAVKDRKSAISF